VVAGRTGDYAGMSNDKAGENPARRKPKVSWGREIRPGLAGALVEAERRRRWTAGQHSCATAANRRRDGIKKVISRLEVAVGDSKVEDWKIRLHKPRGQLEGVYDPEVTGRMSKKIF
jgi:hypothetical protein